MAVKNDFEPQLLDFYINQIRITQKILKEFKNDKYYQTMVINSLLSLVILPLEKAKKNDGDKIFPGKYTELQKKLGILPLIFVPIKACENNSPKFENKTIYAFVRKFRNGIAHQNLGVKAFEDMPVQFTFVNKFYCSDCKKCKTKKCKEKGVEKLGDGMVDFKITCTIEQLQKISLYIADSYLKAIERT